MKSRFRVSATLAIATSASLAGGAPAQDLRKVDMALAGKSMIATVPLFVDDMGFFAKRGLAVNFVTTDSANAAATALISGSVHFAFSGPGEVIAAQARGQDVIAVGSTYKGLGGTLVLAKAVADKLGVSASAPIADRLKALDKLIIASPSPTSAYTLSYKAAAEARGANPSFTYMAIPTMPAAMASGSVQGYVASAPFWLPPVIDGSGVLWISGPKGELPSELRPTNTAITLTMRKFADANTAVVRAAIAAFGDFADAIEKRPADVKAVVAKHFPKLDAKTIDILFEVESEAWKTVPLTPKDIMHEIAIIKQSNPNFPAKIDSIDPALMIFK